MHRNNFLLFFAIICLMIGTRQTLYSQQTNKKTGKSKNETSKSKNDLLIADEALMIAQVDSIVQSEKMKNDSANKRSSKEHKRLISRNKTTHEKISFLKKTKR